MKQREKTTSQKSFRCPLRQARNGSSVEISEEAASKPDKNFEINSVSMISILEESTYSTSGEGF